MMIWPRATSLVEHNDLEPTLHRAAKLTRIINSTGLVVAAVLGALATSFALSGGQTINIHWLLLVLLGFSFLSMLLWLIGIALKRDGLGSGGVAKLTSWFPTLLKAKSQASVTADRAWLTCHFGGRVCK